MAIDSLKYSKFNNDIRLTGLRVSSDKVEQISNEYNYVSNNLMDLHSMVRFGEMPELMTDRKGIQIFSDKNLVLTRTRQSVIVNPNNDVIRVEETNVQMDEDLEVCGEVNIKGDTKIHNNLEILKDVTITRNAEISSNLRVANSLSTNDMQIHSLEKKSIPFVNDLDFISSSQNMRWNNNDNRLEINSELNNVNPGDYLNTIGLSSKGNLTNNGNIINSADLINQNNCYNMNNVFIGGALNVGIDNMSISNLSNITNSYNPDLITDSNFFEKGIHTIKNKPLYIDSQTFINSSIDILNPISRVDQSTTNRLSKSDTVISITGNSKIFNGNLDIIGSNMRKQGDISITPIDKNNNLSSGYAISNTGKNTGSLNIDGMWRIGQHYNIYDKLTSNLDFKT